MTGFGGYSMHFKEIAKNRCVRKIIYGMMIRFCDNLMHFMKAINNYAKKKLWFYDQILKTYVKSKDFENILRFSLFLQCCRPERQMQKQSFPFVVIFYKGAAIKNSPFQQKEIYHNQSKILNNSAWANIKYVFVYMCVCANIVEQHNIRH